jgi:hypothetical protein
VFNDARLAKKLSGNLLCVFRAPLHMGISTNFDVTIFFSGTDRGSLVINSTALKVEAIGFIELVVVFPDDGAIRY